MPDDFQESYRLQKDDSEKQRTIAGFIVGMTDRYAIEFYGRFVSDDPVSIVKTYSHFHHLQSRLFATCQAAFIAFRQASESFATSEGIVSLPIVLRNIKGVNSALPW